MIVVLRTAVAAHEEPTKKWWLGLGLFLICACGKEAPPPTGSRLPTTSTTPVATSSTASSSTTTSSSPPSNRAPSVRVTGDDGCHPRRAGDVVEPCIVSFRAEASDPDGDSLGYRWSQCASGSQPTATCTIDRLASVTAMVEVTDGRGGRASATKTAMGTNLAPVPGNFSCYYRPGQNPGAPDCGSESCPAPLPINGIGYCMDGNFDAFDTERDRVFCGPVTRRGACSGPDLGYGSGIYECGGVEDAYSFEFRTGPEAGDCVLTISMSDSWGASASTTVRVPVRAHP
jgi:hypothetical protein